MVCLKIGINYKVTPKRVVLTDFVCAGRNLVKKNNARNALHID